jgi:GxxExxY protein
MNCHGFSRMGTDKNLKSCFDPWESVKIRGYYCFKDGMKHSDITDKILQGFFEVYNELGDGFLESVYERALLIVLSGYGLKVEAQWSITVYFRNIVIGEFRTDLLISDVVIVELKAVKAIIPEYEAQVINYLKATGIEVGLLLNFGRRPEFKRFVLDKKNGWVWDGVEMKKNVATDGHG